MKKKLLLIPALLFFSLLGTTLFSSCDKDTNSYLDVLVVDEATRAPISGAAITITQEHGETYDEGVTGADGIYSTHFVSPAILNVKAELQLETGGRRRGTTTVRVKEGETVTATVTLPLQAVYN